jgi:flagellin
MSRINTNVAALVSSRVLNNNNAALNKSLERLSTGLRINRGSDDPAGLIASENLRKQIGGTETAIKNAERAVTIIGTAEGSLIEISSMLVELQGLLGEAANTGGMGEEEIDANQLQVDSILNTIDRISNSTEFEGMKLLNGNKAYSTSTVSANKIDELTVNAAKLIDGASMTVVVNRTSAANTGVLYMSGAALTANSGMTIQIGSGRGTTELTFAAATTQASINTAINAVKEITGVSAAISGNTLTMRSVDFGSDAYVSVEILSGNAAGVGIKLVTAVGGTHTTDAKDYGVDAMATVNGTSATADGKKLTIRTAMLDAEIELDATAALSATDWSATFGITSGGADFALGSSVDAIGLESIGIQNVATTALGNSTDGYLSTLKSGGDQSLSGDNLYTAQRIVSSAITDISKLRGRLGSFQKNTLGSTINSLRVTNENLKAAESAIRDTDFATETANLTRTQILVQASTTVLAQANYAPQSVLSLLG